MALFQIKRLISCDFLASRWDFICKQLLLYIVCLLKVLTPLLYQPPTDALRQSGNPKKPWAEYKKERLRDKKQKVSFSMKCLNGEMKSAQLPLVEPRYPSRSTEGGPGLLIWHICTHETEGSRVLSCHCLPVSARLHLINPPSACPLSARSSWPNESGERILRRLHLHAAETSKSVEFYIRSLTLCPPLKIIQPKHE